MRNENFSIFEEFKKREEKRKKRRKIFVFLFFFLFFLFIFSFKFFNHYFRPKAEDIFLNSFQSILSLNSFKSKGIFSVSFESLEKQNIYSLKLQTNSFYEKGEKEKIKTFLQGSFFLKKPNFEIEYSLEGQILKYDNFLYFIFSQISSSLELFFRLFSFDISKWKNQWIRVESKNNFLKDFIEFSEKRNLFQVKKQLPDDFFEGKRVYHLLVVLNKEELFNFLSPFLKSENLSFEDFSEKIGDLEFELFIDKKNFRIYKIVFKKDLEISKNGLPESWKISFLGDVQFFDFEEKNEIFQPVIYKDFQDFYEEFSKIFQSPIFYFLKK